MTLPRVLIDCERLKNSHSGLGQVALNLGQQFQSMPQKTWQPVYLLPSDQRALFGSASEYEVPTWRRRYLPKCAPTYDLWHVLHQDARLLPSKGSPYVLTVHDLNFLQEKSPSKSIKRLRNVQRLVDGASVVTVISAFTKTIVEQHLETHNKPIEVIYNGLCPLKDSLHQPPLNHPQGEFLFTVGVVRRKKNFHTLVKFLTKIEKINLIIAGNTKGQYASEIVQEAHRLGVAERVFIVGEIDDEYKSWLYRHCKAFVFPSLYEGFGLPLLEAMSVGKPIFCAARTSLPEVGGDDVFYWQNFSAAHMAAVYQQGMTEFGQDERIRSRLQARSEQFTWKKAAQAYSDLYQRILE